MFRANKCERGVRKCEDRCSASGNGRSRVSRRRNYPTSARPKRSPRARKCLRGSRGSVVLRFNDFDKVIPFVRSRSVLDAIESALLCGLIAKDDRVRPSLDADYGLGRSDRSERVRGIPRRRSRGRSPGVRVRPLVDARATGWCDDPRPLLNSVIFCTSRRAQCRSVSSGIVIDVPTPRSVHRPPRPSVLAP